MTEIDDVLKSNNEIQKQLSTLQNSIYTLKEQSNQDSINLALSEMKKDISHSITNYIEETLNNEVDTSLNHDCTIHNPCKNTFEEILKSNLENMRKNGVTPEYKKEIKEKIHEVRMNAPKKECGVCIDRMNKMINSHINLLESLNKKSAEKKDQLTNLNEDRLVKEMLDPLSNKQRIQVLKSLSENNQSHSELSKITGLRGGNLIFHLNKLLESGMIVQRHERGDYTITSKGFNLVVLLNSMNDLLD